MSLAIYIVGDATIGKSTFVMQSTVTSSAIPSIPNEFYPMENLGPTSVEISGTINGEPIAGTGQMIEDPRTSTAITTITFTQTPPTWLIPMKGKSWKSRHHPKNPGEIGPDTMSLNELSPEGYDFETRITYTGYEGAITSFGSVRPGSFEATLGGTYLGPNNVNVIGIYPAYEYFWSTEPGVVKSIVTETLLLDDGTKMSLTETKTFRLLNRNAMLTKDQLLLIKTEALNYNEDTKTINLVTKPIMMSYDYIPSIIFLSTGI